MDKDLYEYLKNKIMIPLNSREQVWTDTLNNLIEFHPDNETLIKHFQWSLQDLAEMKKYMEEEFENFERIYG